MQYFAGLDVSLEETSICVVDGKGRVVREARVASDPKAIRRFLKGTDWGFERVGLEAGPLAPWLYRGLVEGGLLAVCLETRRMKAFASASPVKTDRKDAELIAQAVRVGLYQAVHIKSPTSHERRVALQCRHALQGQVQRLEGTVRGLLKGFGVKLGRVGRRGFEPRVRELIADVPAIAGFIEPLLRARQGLLEQFERLDKMVADLACGDEVCRRLMTVPGVGAVTALAFRATVDDPCRFKASQVVGAHFGLTPRRYKSGEHDYTGRISKCGDAMMRSLLYEAGQVVLTRVGADNWLTRWGRKLIPKRGFKRACVAVARRLAVIMHRMWLDSSHFQAWRPTPAAA